MATVKRVISVDIANAPAFGRGVVLGALLMVLRTVTSGLVLGGNPDPDADGFTCKCRYGGG